MSEIEKLAMRIRNGILGLPWNRMIKYSLRDRASKDIDTVVLKELQKFFSEQQARQAYAKKELTNG